MSVATELRDSVAAVSAKVDGAVAKLNALKAQVADLSTKVMSPEDAAALEAARAQLVDVGNRLDGGNA